MSQTETSPISNINSEKLLRRASQLISWVLNPFIIPLLVFTILFVVTYLRILPQAYKLIVLGVICSFTIVIPAISIYIFRRIHKLTMSDISQHRERRFIPFLMTILCYFFCLQLMYKMQLPWYMTGVILAGLFIMVICMIVNFWWKLSEHMAGMGGVVGGIVAFGTLFGYNPLAWLSLFIVVSGILGTCRMVLRHHTLGEVIASFCVGFGCSLFVLDPLLNMKLRFLLEASF